MAGGAAFEHEAEGIIAKAAKSVLRDAEGAAGRDAARAAAGDAARTAGRDAADDAAGSALRDAEHHVDLDALPGWHDGGQPDLFGSANVPPDYKPFGDLDRQSFYDRHYNEAEGHWDYPPHDGFEGDPAPNTLQPGEEIDRYGLPSGSYTSPTDTPFDQRALPPTNLTQPYYRYRIERPLPPEVTEGRIAPAFEQPGGGIQQFFDKPVEWYVREGYLTQVYP